MPAQIKWDEIVHFLHSDPIWMSIPAAFESAIVIKLEIRLESKPNGTKETFSMHFRPIFNPLHSWTNRKWVPS